MHGQIIKKTYPKQSITPKGTPELFAKRKAQKEHHFQSMS